MIGSCGDEALWGLIPVSVSAPVTDCRTQAAHDQAEEQGPGVKVHMCGNRRGKWHRHQSVSMRGHNARRGSVRLIIIIM